MRAANPPRGEFMAKVAYVLLIATALAMPVIGQEHRDQASRVYQDQRHHDTHEWNSEEDQKYRAYLQEHHRKYRDFSRASRKEQNNYWDWRHQH
jgi:hypothetical protein